MQDGGGFPAFSQIRANQGPHLHGLSDEVTVGMAEINPQQSRQDGLVPVIAQRQKEKEHLISTGNKVLSSRLEYCNQLFVSVFTKQAANHDKTSHSYPCNGKRLTNLRAELMYVAVQRRSRAWSSQCSSKAPLRTLRKRAASDPHSKLAGKLSNNRLTN